MPTRLIRQGINDSERVNYLDWAAEVFYRRLLNVVDDYGLYDGRLSVLRADLYKTKLSQVREADIQRWMAECQKAGLIVLYTVDGKPYLKVLDTKWDTRSRPKYPEPTNEQIQTVVNSCKQLFGYSYSYSYSNAQSYSNAHVCGTDAGFDAFWECWPKHKRKIDRKKCREHWKRHKLDESQQAIIDGLNAWKASKAWLEKDGEFIPLPMTWLNGERWNDKPEPAEDAPKPLTPEMVEEMKQW
jgi:hypothetical protein